MVCGNDWSETVIVLMSRRSAIAVIFPLFTVSALKYPRKPIYLTPGKSDPTHAGRIAINSCYNPMPRKKPTPSESYSSTKTSTLHLVNTPLQHPPSPLLKLSPADGLPLPLPNRIAPLQLRPLLRIPRDGIIHPITPAPPTPQQTRALVHHRFRTSVPTVAPPPRRPAQRGYPRPPPQHRVHAADDNQRREHAARGRECRERRHVAAQRPRAELEALGWRWADHGV